MSYEKWEIAKNKELIRQNFFEGEENYAESKSHILKNVTLNLYDDIRGDKDDIKSVIHYFDTNDIVWHKKGGEPTGSTISSQVSCLNHLFPIRQNKDAILKMINMIQIKGVANNFSEVLPIRRKYINFEVKDPNNLLDENRKEGVGCTPIDALVKAKDNEGKIWIIVFEWKYTESYATPIDKSVQDRKPKGKDIEVEGLGKSRMARYNKLIQKSSSLIPLCKKDPSNTTMVKRSVYYHEPYYELMRQTLWAELITKCIKGEKKEFLSDAQDYLHICVVPKANKALLDMGFDDVGNTMEETWRNCLTEEGKERFKIMSPEELFEPFINRHNILKDSIKSPGDFIGYLETRYWRNDLKKDFESAVNKTEEELVNHRDCKDGTKGWAKGFSDYADELNKKIKDYEVKGEKIKEIIAELNIPDEVQLYSSVSKVKYTKKGNACYELRFCGQRICGVNVLDSDVKIQFSSDDIKRNKKWFKIKDMEGMPLREAEIFFESFTSPIIKDAKVKSCEHKLESLVLREMAKGREAFRVIEPVKLGAGFFQMPSAVKASTLVPEISRKENGVIMCGHIDILAKVSFPNGGWMPAVIEVKDENKPVEPVEDVMIQALIYATFLGHLLADKDCGEAWYNIIGGKGQNGKCPVPDTIDILVVAMMPPKKYGEPDKINETHITFEVGDNDKKKTIKLIPCTCYINTDENFTTINSVEWSCFKKNG